MGLLKIAEKKRAKEFFCIKKSDLKKRLLPLILFFLLILSDQITKALVVHFIHYGNGFSLVGEWIRITHVRNQGIAWSGFQDLVGFGRVFLLIVLPSFFLLAFGIWTFFSDEWTTVQRWAATAIIAGGVGNIIDRIFRYAAGPHDIYNGVVDWIDMAFFKIPHFTPTGRWPTFNIADSSVVIGICILVVSIFVSDIKTQKKKR